MQTVEPSAKTDTSKLSLIIKIIVIIFAMNLLIDRASQLLPIYTLGGNFSLQNTLMTSFKLPYFWTGLLVPIIYLFALWEAANFLRTFEISKSFDPDSLKHLQSIGADLMYAAMAAILLVPTIEAWVNQGVRNFKTDWNLDAVTIGMIGLILKYVAQRASNLQRKVDSVV